MSGRHLRCVVLAALVVTGCAPGSAGRLPVTGSVSDRCHGAAAAIVGIEAAARAFGPIAGAVDLPTAVAKLVLDSECPEAAAAVWGVEDG